MSFRNRAAARAALAIIDLRSGLAPEESRFTLFEETLVTRENYDGLVYAYRTYPPLLRHLIDRSRVPRRRIFELLADAHDTSLARSLGIAIPREARPTAQLSPREEEVFELMQQGRKNREIAAALFISPATVKVHVRHILEKLNARTRTEAVLRDQDARASATARSEADEPMSP